MSESIEYLQDWFTDHPTAVVVFQYVLWVLVTLLSIQFLRRLLRRKLPDTEVRYKAQKGAEIFGYIFLVILTISYFTGNVQDFTLAIGLFTAGIAITLQEIILSIAGSFYIFFIKVYNPGDRIEINGIKGDVIDIDSIYTTIMEIGEWVGSDNYSGRIVKLSNAFVFKGPVFNYSKDFPFIWDEFNLPIRYGSDMDLAKQLIIEVTTEVLADYTTESKAQWSEVVNKYYIEDAVVDPTLAITLTDNWIQCNLRYIVDYRKRRFTKHLLYEKIHAAVNGTQGRIKLASATHEVVEMPEIKIKLTKD